MEGFEVILCIYTVLVGLCVGSFLNVLIYRLPREESLISPPSHCPSCNTPIKWYDNIPIFSYLFLGGKCRSCKTKISPRYIAVEALNAALWVLCLFAFEMSFYSVFAMLFCSCMIAVFFIDLKHMIIPDSLVIAVAVIAAASFFFGDFILFKQTVLLSVWEKIIGGVGAGVFFYQRNQQAGRQHHYH